LRLTAGVDSGCAVDELVGTLVEPVAVLSHRAAEFLMELDEVGELLLFDALEDLLDGTTVSKSIRIGWSPYCSTYSAAVSGKSSSSLIFFASTAWPYCRIPSLPCSPSGSCGQSILMF